MESKLEKHEWQLLKTLLATPGDRELAADILRNKPLILEDLYRVFFIMIQSCIALPVNNTPTNPLWSLMTNTKKGILEQDWNGDDSISTELTERERLGTSDRSMHSTEEQPQHSQTIREQIPRWQWKGALETDTHDGTRQPSRKVSKKHPPAP